MIYRGGKLSMPGPWEIKTFFPGMKTVMPIQWDNQLVNNTILAKKQR
jgi:hypothetical protein